MTKIPILILHGWNLSKKQLLPLEKEFTQKGFIVFNIDLPGFGNSEKPQKALTLSDYVEYVRQFLKRKKINKIVVIGHSFGGRVALKMASSYPNLIHSLVITGTPGFTPVGQVKIKFFIYLAKIGKIILSLPILSRLENPARNFLYQLARAKDFYNTNPYLRQTFKNIISERLDSFMKNITAQTLLIWGEEDRIVPLKIAEKMKATIKNCQLIVIAKARHGVVWTHSKIFVEKCLNYWQKMKVEENSHLHPETKNEGT